MTMFWIVAALFLAGALLLMLPSLIAPRGGVVTAGGANLALHRDQMREVEQDLAAGLIGSDAYEQARREIRRRVLEDAGTADRPVSVRPARWTALAVGLLIPLVSVLLYLRLGSPESTAPRPVVPASQRHALAPQQIQQMASGLAERLKSAPGDAEGWLTLGRSYAALGRFRDAAMAYQRAVELLPPNPTLLADLADLTGMAQGKRLAGEPARLVQQALDLDPRHVKALALAGSVAMESRDYAAARGYWERLLAVVPADSPSARSARGSIAEANRLEGGAPAARTVVLAASASAAASGSTLRGEVVLSPELASRVAPGDTLFIFARAAEGPRMPLAIVRRPAVGGRSTFELDDSMAMSPAMRLSAFTRVVVGVRISRSGSATPQSGDLIGLSAVVAPGADGIRVTIDTVQP